MDAERRFRSLFEQTYASVRRYALYRGMNGADADDLVADVFTVAWRKLEDIPDEDPVPWLFAVARNHWRNAVRKKRRDIDLLGRLEVPEPANDPDDRSPLVRAALARLGDNDQEILRLTAWDGLTPQQIAVVLGCSAEAARVRLHRARRRLAETFTTLETQNSHPIQEVRDGR